MKGLPTPGTHHHSTQDQQAEANHFCLPPGTMLGPLRGWAGGTKHPVAAEPFLHYILDCEVWHFGPVAWGALGFPGLLTQEELSITPTGVFPPSTPLQALFQACN